MRTLAECIVVLGESVIEAQVMLDESVDTDLEVLAALDRSMPRALVETLTPPILRVQATHFDVAIELSRAYSFDASATVETRGRPVTTFAQARFSNETRDAMRLTFEVHAVPELGPWGRHGE